MQIMSLRSTYP